MRTMDIKRRKAIIAVLTVLLLYFCIRIQTYEYRTKIILPDAKPADVWEFMADFSNMKRLNPTMLDFKVLSESGNYQHWKYTVEYSEKLSHWPYLFNTAVALFDVIPDPTNGSFYVYSVHRTCMIVGFYCLDTMCNYTFTENEPTGSTFEERIVYECPAFLSAFCHREVEFQRNAIAANLKEEF